MDGNKLKLIIIEIERMLGERQMINEQIKSTLKTAEDDGFSKKIIQLIIKRRSQDPVLIEEEEALLEEYESMIS